MVPPMRFVLGMIAGILITIHLHHARWWQHVLWWTFTTDQRTKKRTRRHQVTQRCGLVMGRDPATRERHGAESDRRTLPR